MADEAVLAAFKKFDADGSGAISREELGEVLQALKEAEPWEDEDIDQMLAAADASGDGELQIEEFVKWIFAEDQELSENVKAKASLTVAGCSRDEFNGEYKQKEDEFYYRRPIFYCESQDKYLFYHGARKQWSLYHRTGSKCSSRIKTTRSAHQPGEGKTWAVFKRSSPDSAKKSMVKETGMSCTANVVTAKPENAEELLAQAEPCIKFDELYYKQIDGVIGNRAVYQQSKGEDKWEDTFIFYEMAEKCWKRGNEKEEGKPSLNVSRTTTTPSPEKAAWFDESVGGKLLVMSVDTDGIPNNTGKKLTLDRSVPDGWKDEAFPHEKSSIGNKVWNKNSSMSMMKWYRCLALVKSPVLFADVGPGDALQGSVGNCWLVAAIAALAEFPSYLKNNIFMTKKVNKEGKYHLKLYNGKLDRWTVIQVDDYLPCTGWGDNPSLYFGKINDGKLCFVLLEKAFAKMYGSYSGLSSGFQPVAWFHLTGCKEFFRINHIYNGPVLWSVTGSGCTVYSSKYKTGKKGILASGARLIEQGRSGSWIKYKKYDGDGPDEGWLQYYVQGKRVATRTPKYPGRVLFAHMHIMPSLVHLGVRGDTEQGENGWSKAFRLGATRYITHDDVWQKLLAYDKGNYLMASTCNTVTNESSSGLVHGHAFSILHAVQIDGIKLVGMRNPWGSDTEWNGPWGDRSPEWRHNRHIAEALNVDFQEDGTFWMEFEDWLYCMGKSLVMNCSMPTTRGDFHSQIIGEDDDGPGGDPDNDFDDEDDDHNFGAGSKPEIWQTPPKSGGRLVACSGLNVEWNAPVVMQNGTLLHPGESDRTFQNVPSFLEGLTYFGHGLNVDRGTLLIEFEPPHRTYIWLLEGATNSLELVLPTTGWTQVAAPGFQTSDGINLLLFMKDHEGADFYTGKYDAARVAYPPFCGGVVGVYPVPKEPHMRKGDEENDSKSSLPTSAVTACSGLEVEWFGPMPMADGVPTNPDKDYVFENVPSVLQGGSYIGTHCWPRPGTWTIEYCAPCKLYIWAREGEFNAGVSDFLAADGWAREPCEGFQRSAAHDEGAAALVLWGRHFDSGSSYSIETTYLMVAGVVGQPLDVGGEVISCEGLDVEWNPPKVIHDGVLTNPGDRDFTFQSVPEFMCGGIYIGTRCWPSGGTWTIQYQAPTLLFIWVDKGEYNAGVDDALRGDGWVMVEAPDFRRVQQGGTNPLTVWSRHFASGSSYSIETTGLVVGGVVSAPCDD